MADERTVRIWTQVGHQAQGAPISLAHVCAAAAAGVGVDGAGLTVVVTRTVREAVSVTDPVAGALEELQLTLGQGPCVDALAAGGPVLAVDLGSRDCHTRWSAFTPAALDCGVRAVFALPLQIGAIRLGVLDLYRRRPGGLSTPELADALSFAETAGLLLVDGIAGGHRDAADQAWRRDEPSDHDAVVYQAMGMMLVQLAVSADTAFARLRAYAYAHNRRLRDVAREVVDRRLRFDPDPGADPGSEPDADPGPERGLR